MTGLMTFICQNHQVKVHIVFIELSLKKAGEAARLRENAKKSKYVTVETYNNYHFVPIAIETLGPWGDDAKK
jgi:hypothetical protein